MYEPKIIFHSSASKVTNCFGKETMKNSMEDSPLWESGSRSSSQ